MMRRAAESLGRGRRATATVAGLLAWLALAATVRARGESRTVAPSKLAVPPRPATRSATVEARFVRLAIEVVDHAFRLRLDESDLAASRGRETNIIAVTQA